MAKKMKSRTAKVAIQISDAELIAMSRVLEALGDLDAAFQQNVIDWAVRRFKLRGPYASIRDERSDDPDLSEPGRQITIDEPEREPEPESKSPLKAQDAEIEGINSVAQKWIKRAGLTENQLSKLFTLGVDDIDVVAKRLPGKNKIERLKNVLLLQGVAAYLGSGVARVEWAKLKQSATHYNADAGGNFATYMKKFAPEASGSVQTGYTLTSRGLSEAKELIEQMTAPPTKN